MSRKQLCVVFLGMWVALLALPPVNASAAVPQEPDRPDPAPDAAKVASDNAAATDVAVSPADSPVNGVADLRPGYWSQSPLPISGRAMYYNPGVMERVLAYRQRTGAITRCDECIGYVALLRAGDLDRRIWLQRPGQPAEGPFWVIDVASRHHIPLLLQRNWAVDVDWETAQRWEMRGPTPVTVLAEAPFYAPPWPDVPQPSVHCNLLTSC